MLRISWEVNFFIKILEILKNFREFLCVCGLAKIHTPVFNVGMEYPHGLFQSNFRNANV